MLITAYLEGGLLKFKVSCGAQRIRFSDPRRVDSGFRQMIDVSLSIEDNGGAIGKGGSLIRSATHERQQLSRNIHQLKAQKQSSSEICVNEM